MPGLTFDELRLRHPRLILQRVEIDPQSAGLEIRPVLTLEPDITFTSRFIIHGVTAAHLERLAPGELEWFGLQLGLIETLSYWKAACPPVIEVAAGWLTTEQLAWWQDLLVQGLGEFFYRNQLDFTRPDLVQWVVTAPEKVFHHPNPTASTSPTRSILLPLGGGKDSLVSQDLVLNWLNHSEPATRAEVGYLVVNPTPAAVDSTRLRPVGQVITVDRQLDPQLMALNQQGYLNGHTPFSAMVAWVSSLCARLFNFETVAVSNERSSNEGNVQYLGHEINHQYSKTFAFEQSFQNYVRPVMGERPLYFSLLRPVYELQIARHFATVIERYPELGQSFRSCNVGQKTNSWCGHCSKCLFAFLILSPFVAPETLSNIFGYNLLTNLELEPIALELFGKRDAKPFECVGTFEESLIATYLTWQRYQAQQLELPALLAKLVETVVAKEEHLSERSATLLSAWNTAHSLPADLEAIVKPLTQPLQPKPAP